MNTTLDINADIDPSCNIDARAIEHARIALIGALGPKLDLPLGEIDYILIRKAVVACVSVYESVKQRLGSP